MGMSKVLMYGCVQVSHWNCLLERSCICFIISNVESHSILSWPGLHTLKILLMWKIEPLTVQFCLRSSSVLMMSQVKLFPKLLFASSVFQISVDNRDMYEIMSSCLNSLTLSCYLFSQIKKISFFLDLIFNDGAGGKDICPQGPEEGIK